MSCTEMEHCWRDQNVLIPSIYHAKIIMIILAVLKAVETVGVKHIKGSDGYKTALQDEFMKLRKQGIFNHLLKVKRVNIKPILE